MNNVTWKVLTYNTQLYEQGNNLGRRSAMVKPIDLACFQSIMNFVLEWVNTGTSVALLQEIPYCCNVTWKEHELYSEFLKTFPAQEYTVVMNVTTPRQIKMTVAIARAGLIERDCGLNNNRCVSIKTAGSEFRMLGVHSHDANELLRELSEEKDYHPHVILGDFNSGDYDKGFVDPAFEVNRRNFLSLSTGYYDLFHGEYTTIYKTCIDHVLIEKNEFLSNVDIGQVMVHRNIKLSDHYPLSFEISLPGLY